jgi:DNA adenine methylase
LRYPGSKARFCGFIAKTIALNTVKPRLFVEPFCGGASVSIALLEDGVVEEVAINDADPLIGNLWSTVFSKAGARWLAGQVETVPLTVDEWKRQKALKPTSAREAALKGLFLNRTSFNGIMHQSGPLGGWGQKCIKIDVRFNRDKLAARILELSELRSCVTVGNEGWKPFCRRFAKEPRAIFYLDPPYYHRAEQLYGHVFDEDGHEGLRDFLDGFTPPWMLSYDDAQEIRDLYAEVTSKARVIDNSYSTHPLGGCSFIGRELVYTNMKRLPAPDKRDAEHVGMTVKAAGRARAQPVDALRFPISASASVSAAAPSQS